MEPPCSARRSTHSSGATQDWRERAPSRTSAPSSAGAIGAPKRESCSARHSTPPTTRAPSRSRDRDRKSTRLNSSHTVISYAVFCLKKKKKTKLKLLIKKKKKKKKKKIKKKNKM